MNACAAVALAVLASACEVNAAGQRRPNTAVVSAVAIAGTASAEVYCFVDCATWGKETVGAADVVFGVPILLLVLFTEMAHGVN